MPDYSLRFLWWSLISPEHDQRKMTPPSLRFPLLAHQSEELSKPFRSFQCTLVAGLIFFFTYESNFVIELKTVSIQRCSTSLWIQNYFCRHGFLSLIASLQATGVCFVAVTVFTTSSVFTFHYRVLILSCLVDVPGFKNIKLFLSLNATLKGWPFKVFVIVFKIISLTGHHTSSCFQVISLPGRFAASYFVTELLFNIISVADHLAPSCYFVDLFPWLIVTLVRNELPSHG